MSDKGGAEQYTRTVNSASTTITFTRTSKALMVVNADSADTVQVSFDSGTTWTRVLPLTSALIEMCVADIVLRSDASVTAAATASIDILNIHGK